MKELLTYIVQNLVEKPDEVSVTEREANGETVFEVRVADGDMGKVIGRQGRIVKEIRIPSTTFSRASVTHRRAHYASMPTVRLLPPSRHRCRIRSCASA